MICRMNPRMRCSPSEIYDELMLTIEQLIPLTEVMTMWLKKSRGYAGGRDVEYGC